MGTEFGNFNQLRLLIPFLSKVTAVRLLSNPDDAAFVDKMRELNQSGKHMEKISEETGNRLWPPFRYIELGCDDLIFELGERYQVKAEGGWENDVDGKEVWKRHVKRVERGKVAHWPIWEMDSLSI